MSNEIHVHEWKSGSMPFFYICNCGETYIWIPFIGDHPCPRCNVIVPDREFHYCKGEASSVMSIDLEIRRSWVNAVIETEAQIPYARDFYRGYRLFLKGVNLILESNGFMWLASKPLKSGDEVVLITTMEIIKI